jgi:hypothetical protein
MLQAIAYPMRVVVSLFLLQIQGNEKSNFEFIKQGLNLIKKGKM